MTLGQEPIFLWMSQFAFQPEMVYAALVVMMILSAFGLPLPEEVTLLSVGLLAFMGANPQLFPPPFPGAAVVHPTEAAIIASLAVFGADFLVYFIGRRWGRKLLKHRRLERLFPETLVLKAEEFTKKYGSLATGIFRFLPGVRFPGHLLCGTLRFSPWKFALIDGLAVMISVPTQILLLAHYGEDIIFYLKKIKLFIFGGLCLLACYFIFKKIQDIKKAAN